MLTYTMKLFLSSHKANNYERFKLGTVTFSSHIWILRLRESRVHFSQGTSIRSIPKLIFRFTKKLTLTKSERNKTMNWKSLFFVLWPCRRPFFAAILVGALLPLVVSAQEAEEATAEEEEEDILALSPFVVDETRTVGYLATSTLAGTRLQTPLKDVAASVFVFTPELIEDTGMTDINDAFLYGANTESNGGNYAGVNSVLSGGAELGGAFAPQNSNPQAAQRVRGLTAADITRGYFTSAIPMDMFNIDSATLVRGPNSILFGLGSPAGIFNYTPKRAEFRNKGKLQLRYGENDMYRTVFDLNQELKENELAARIVGLYDDREFNQKPAWDREKRFYGTVTWRPMKGKTGTTIRASGEWLAIDQNLPTVFPPVNDYQEWIDKGQPSWDPRANQLDADGNVVLDVNGNPVQAAIPAGLGAQGGTFIAMYDGSGKAPFFTTQPTEGDSRNGGNTPRINLIRPRRGWVNSRSGTPRFFSRLSIVDRGQFDYVKLNPGGPGAGNTWSGSTWNVTVEQKLLENAYVEFAYNHEEFNKETTSPNRIGNIRVDANEFYPSGEPNPNFRRPYFFGGDIGVISWTDHEEYRFTGSYVLDLEKRNKWFGKHHLTFLFNKLEIREKILPWRDVVVGDNGIIDVPIGADFQITSSARRSHSQVSYLGPPVGADGIPRGLNTIEQNPIPHEAFRGKFSKEIQNVRYFAPDKDADGNSLLTGEWRDDGAITVARSAFGGFNQSNTKNEFESVAVVGQSRMFKRGDGESHFFVTTVGWRRDEVTGFSAPQLALGQDGFYLADNANWPIDFDNPSFAAENSLTIGVVAHPTKWLSVHYNDSSNFVAESARVDNFGRPLAPENGTGKDYGFSVELLKGKFRAKVNFFETDQFNVDQGTVQFVAFWRVNNMEQGILQRLTDLGRESEFPAAPPGWPGRVPALAGVTNFAAEGLEAEFVFNPTPNWRIMFNIARQETVESDVGPSLKEWIEVRETAWRGTTWYSANGPGGPCCSDDGTVEWRPGTKGTAIETFEDRMQQLVKDPFATAQLLEGRNSHQQAEWRWNAVSNYTFTEGWLDGFNLGGAARWGDNTVTGYPLTTDAQGTDVTDVENPFFGDDSFNVDLWFGYTRRIMSDRAEWKLQLNLRNVGENDDDLVPITTNPDGNVASFRIPQGFTWFITSTIRF